MDCIIGVDPGVTTGIAVLRPECVNAWTWWEFGPYKHHLELWEFFKVENPDIIICESFEFRQIPADMKRRNIRLESREYIGICELYHQRVPSCELVFQTAGMMKGGPFGPKKGVLKKLGLYQAAQGRQHMNDATSHVLQWATTKGKMTWLLDPIRPD
jgi:hypothetical protein